MGSGKRYYSECMTYMPRRICQKQTFIRYHCCTGFEKAEGDDSKGCRAGEKMSIHEKYLNLINNLFKINPSINISFIVAVAPVENLVRTIRRLHLIEFGDYATDVGLNDFLSTNGIFTVFVPENRAIQNISETTE